MPLPAGYQLDEAPKLPAGYTLDAPAAPQTPVPEKPKTWSEKLGLQNPIAQGITDAAEGAASGAASTMFHGGDLIRRGLGMERVIDRPEVQNAMMAPPTLSGKVGRGAEQAAEFLIPAGLVGKGVKAAEAATAGVRYAPAIQALGKAALEGMAAGGVAGAQTGGDPKSMRNAALAAGGTSAVLSGAGALLPSKQALAERLYGSALKPPPSMGASERSAIINTGLKEGITLDPGVVENVQNRISQLNNQISSEIEKRSAAGAVVNPAAVAKYTDRSAARFANQVNPDSDLAAVKGATNEFLANNSIKAPYSGIRPGLEEQTGSMVPSGENGVALHPRDIPLLDAQKMKQGTYAKLKDSYGEQASAAREAQKDLARGLKDKIVEAFPEIANLNAKESALLSLESSLERFAGREGNKQLIGLGTPMAAAASHAAGLPVVPLTILKAALEMPEIKSRIAIALAKSAANPGVASRAAAVGMRAAPAAAAYGTMPPPQQQRNMPPPGAQR